MKNILIAILTSLLLFGASAGTSLYLNQPVESPSDSSLAEEKLELPATDPFAEPPIENMASQMPVASRPDQALTIEAVRQMSESAEKRQSVLDDFEKQLKAEEQRIKILFEDLKREKMELTAFSEGVDSKVQALDRKTVQLRDLLVKIETEKKDLKSVQKKAGVETEKTNELIAKVNEVKGWFETLEAQQAAAIITDKANQGDMDFAAELLHALQDRQKTKILQAINDPALVNQLIDSVQVKKKKNRKK